MRAGYFNLVLHFKLSSLPALHQIDALLLMCERGLNCTIKVWALDGHVQKLKYYWSKHIKPLSIMKKATHIREDPRKYTY